MNFSKIKKLAEEMNVSIVELAEITGLSPQGIHKFVRNKNCKVSELEKISDVLQVSPAYWWEDEEKYPSGGGKTQNNNNLNELEMNYGELIPVRVHERMMDHLEGEINYLREELNDLRHGDQESKNVPATFIKQS